MKNQWWLISIAGMSDHAPIGDRFGKMSVRFIDVTWEFDVSQDVVYLVQSFASEPLNIAPAGRRHVGGQDDIGGVILRPAA